MEETAIYSDIRELETPVGAFTVTSDSEKIAFSVYHNGMGDIPYGVTDDDGRVLGEIRTDTNYRIEIDANSLQIGKEYRIQFSAGTWEYCDSDERTTCYDAVIDDWAVGIGAYDPNAEEKEDQAWAYSKKMGFQGYCQEPLQYDESRFRQYDVEALDSLNGYRFKLFDADAKSVRFEVAWIKTGEYETIEYEGALGLWLT